MNKKVLVALGGNAILKHKEKGTAEEQFENITETCKALADLVDKGYRIAITHGNGPQVGDILLKNEMAKNSLPPMPLDVCGAESQGMIGYMLQQSMQNELRKLKLDTCVVTVITQAMVDKNDPAFKNPTKPIGPFYTAMEASKLRKEKNWTVINDSGRGYRRVVPSPDPKSIIENCAVRLLFEEGHLIIACGGGGIPVALKGEDGTFEGVEAVIDKDHTAATLATTIGADALLILTDVDKVFLNYGKSSQKAIDKMTVDEAKKYMDEEQFASGSMRPKIESAIRFLESGGKEAIITSIKHAKEALEGKKGTIITNA